MDRLTGGWHTSAHLGPEERAFVASRDSFYLATVGESGWPYVQHRGGPAGFLRVLPPAPGEHPEEDASTLVWADLRGNRQYLSVGNLGASPRVSLLLMDYPAQRRLKILGTAQVLDLPEVDPDLLHDLRAAHSPARVERVIQVRVHSYDWNCPQHITPRWTSAEIAAELAPLYAELHRLRTENAALRAAQQDQPHLKELE